MHFPGAKILHRFGRGRDMVREVARLFESGGPFARFPGPAACVDATGRVLAANDKAGEILPDLAQGPGTKLSQALHEALAQGTVTAATVTVAQTQGSIAVTVVPVDPGPDGAKSALLFGRDMTLMRNLRAALTESRQRYKDLVEISSDFAWETDAEGKLVFVSPRGALGYRANQLVGHDPRALFIIHPTDEAALPFFARAPREDATVWARRADGKLSCLLVSCVPVTAETGDWRGARGVARDVTEARERDAALARARAREQLLAYIVRQIRDEIVPQNMMNAAAAAIAKAFAAGGCRIYRARFEGGFVLAAEFGTVPATPEAPLSALGHGNERCHANSDGRLVLAIATRYRHAVNGAISLWREQGDSEFDKDDLGLLGEVANQIGIALEQLANHEELERLSRTDTLTGLLNRRVFIEEVSRRLIGAERSGHAGALGYIDLDNFKYVNDNLGHQQGDRALVAVADILRSHAGETELAARLGGDEFAFWIEDADEKRATAKAAALRAATVALARYSGDAAHPIGFSIGIAVFEPQAGERLDQLMARADEAMYSVKKSGKNGSAIAEKALAQGGAR